jgi:cation:H+ antiporter|tara:strand:+ start:20650 stop:21621 length:972 start_codon:yes stop_codon:yes gene_type:complete
VAGIVLSDPLSLDAFIVLITVSLLVLGLALLFGGGEALVRGGVSLALRFGLSPLIVGLTVVAFGTSLPELLVSVQAALSGSPDIAVGNVVGSNIANILLILGATAVIAPITMAFKTVSRDLMIMIAAAVAMLALGWVGLIERWMGMAMLASLIIYLIFACRNTPCEDDPSDTSMSKLLWWQETLAILGGLVALMVGANLLVGSATDIARTFGVSEAVIGLTIVAVGTSLPELAASLVAAIRRQSDIAIGNVVGSNIFNILAILGITAMIEPITVSPEMARMDIPVMIGISILLTGLIFALNGLGRIVGAGFLGLYGSYVVYLY